jgi:hypothetical protein
MIVSSKRALEVAAIAHQRLRAEFRALYPDADEQTILDTVEGQSEIRDVMLMVLESGLEDEMLAAAAMARSEEIKARAGRLAQRAENKRMMVLRAMEACGITKIEAETLTASTRRVPGKVLINDEAAVPGIYMVEPVPPPPHPNKSAILSALKAGMKVPGCTLSNGGVTLTIRKS